MSPPPPGFRWRSAAAAAALAVVAIIAFYWNSGRSQQPPAIAEVKSRSSPTIAASGTPAEPLPSLADDTETVRGDKTEVVWGLSSPTAGETVDATNLQFRWEARSNAAMYELKVVSDVGDVLWEQRTKSTSAKMPARVHLVAGKSYYVWLSVQTENGRIDRAKAVEFIAGRTK